MNAFTLGAQLVNSDVEVLVWILGVFQDDWIEETSALDLLVRG